jgi:hypothetical protein
LAVEVEVAAGENIEVEVVPGEKLVDLAEEEFLRAAEQGEEEEEELGPEEVEGQEGEQELEPQGTADPG